MLLEQLASSREKRRWTEVLSPLLYPGYKEWIWVLWVLWVICWLDEAHILSVVKSKANTFSPWVRRETGYAAQEDLKFISSYDMGEGRMITVWFFFSCIPRPSLVLSALSSLGHHNLHLFYMKYIYSIALSSTSILFLHPYLYHYHIKLWLIWNMVAWEQTVWMVSVRKIRKDLGT